ncbi:BREX-1 system adenine-specific DNA-methyltransferase PglX [Cerasibacillus terrae]|uniref:site-specific DNA-methyltransferase (adenine-specific) n=1 Tax=Cerasibacillus terrae TaxID=2498845 RepID=A0A5C8NTK7_9BACI|nr:BREX-1 system adenine-specific DNA-methyltransferase PglX [Cerasibacillus terrae]TXL64463.1 BREX-1 system adenine-specific DNA-methyltransferase PglX [Cerasibacillus terrae]
MNKSVLKTFAIKAREELLEKVALQARKIGISEDRIQDATLESSDAIYVDGRLLYDDERKQRDNLIARVKEIGFNRVMEETAYTWFNRFVALRFMEVNNYLPTKVRVLSSEDGESNVPDMIKEVLSLDLDIDKEYVYELKMNNDTEELFKYLITLHCNDLNRYMPFMFETIEDYMLILFPEGLLGTDSFVREMIDTDQILEEDWKEVEIIGWMYQYYIAVENERVIRAKKRYKKEEIPYATQLFTPKWIVRYMVQNSLGRYWIEAHPEQYDLIKNWEYYLEPREKNFEKKLEPYMNRQLNVEDIKCFDPAMGSGHILVYMFDVLFEIYSECGYIKRDIPRLIIENNLYGLDIDNRAYQLACFSVVMKALEYNKRFLRHIERDGLTLNLSAIQETSHLNTNDITFLAGESLGETYDLMSEFVNQFKDAKAIGSLIKIESLDLDFLQRRLSIIEKESDDLFAVEQKDRILPLFKQLIKQAKIMNEKYDVFVTNPPYAGRRYVTKEVTAYLDEYYPEVKSDLFSSFIEYSFSVTKENGQMGFMTPYVWMFISSYEKLRRKMIKDRNISSLVQLEYSGFDGATVPICTFTLRNYNSGTDGEYVRLADFRGAANQPIKTLEAVQDPSVPYRYSFNQENFSKIPGSPIAYWARNAFINNFEEKSIMDFYEVRSGIMTGNDSLHLRIWFEVNQKKINFRCKYPSDMADYVWFPINKGGEYKKYYGNNEYVINLEKNGEKIKENSKNFRLRDKKYYFKSGITWSRISSSKIAFRVNEAGTLFGDAGPIIFIKNINERIYILAFLVSKVTNELLKFINPTLNYQIRDIETLPLIFDKDKERDIVEMMEDNIKLSIFDWDSFETSWDFSKHPLLKFPASTIKSSFKQWSDFAENQFYRLKKNEEELNRIFIEIYGLQDELTPEVAEEDVTVRKADLERDIRSFISYAIGCSFGRYSLDEEGLVYAGGEFDGSRYKTFPADKDNILPILPGAYFEDDIVTRFIDFVRVTYGDETLEENLNFVADAIGRKKNETARESIRRYVLNNFYKDHVKTYKKRPIYWLFTSGKEKAFNCLIYMHRYDKTTLSRIRTDYLHDVQTRYETIRNDLLSLIASDATSSEIRHAKKELKSIEKKIAELKEYDEKLHHMADMQIEIDLDDGVKVNYEEFKGLVAKI